MWVLVNGKQYCTPDLDEAVANQLLSAYVNLFLCVDFRLMVLTEPLNRCLSTEPLGEGRRLYYMQILLLKVFQIITEHCQKRHVFRI